MHLYAKNVIAEGYPPAECPDRMNWFIHIGYSDTIKSISLTKTAWKPDTIVV